MYSWPQVRQLVLAHLLPMLLSRLRLGAGDEGSGRDGNLRGSFSQDQ